MDACVFRHLENLYVSAFWTFEVCCCEYLHYNGSGSSNLYNCIVIYFSCHWKGKVNMTTIAFAIFAALLMAAAVALFIAIVLDFSVVGALLLLALMDVFILAGGYIAIKRSAH